MVSFLIADTFTDSLAKLTGEEQKAAKTTAFDLQLNPANPGLSFHKLDRARDKNFWSVRVSRDIRIIVHRTESSLLLCYVDHHDKAYHWAERRKLETHPSTGAAQLVEVRETVQDVMVPVYVPVDRLMEQGPPLFAGIAESTLLSYGVPPEWLEDVLKADEDGLLQLADHLPAEAAEALLELATGGVPKVPAVVQGIDPFEHPDAQRRFRVVTDVDELARALEFPWEKWTVFLHPAQQQIVEKNYNGPVRVSGSAGTGKTVVALHRAVHLARSHPEVRVLLTTFSTTLADALRAKLGCLIGSEPRLAERIEVDAVDEIGERLYKARIGPLSLADRDHIRSVLEEAAAEVKENRFTLRFLLGEWEDVVDAWQLDGWEQYRDIKRLGRKTRLPEQQRAVLWEIFQQVRERLLSEGLITRAGMFTRLSEHLQLTQKLPFEFIVVDEAQDVSVSQLRFLAALGGSSANGLFFAGDLGQRIFQTPFSWKSLGVEIRGRSFTLRTNYRTSHQIRRQADRLLSPEITDVDGNAEDRRGTVSVFNGPEPDICALDSREEEIAMVAAWIKSLSDGGLVPHEIGIFVRSEQELPRALAAVEQAGLESDVLGEKVTTTSGKVSISTMHLAKGLEFRAVAVVACDDEVIPSQVRLESVADDADLEEVYETERHLLYVACTRARDYLLVTAVEPASEFLEDLLA